MAGKARAKTACRHGHLGAEDAEDAATTKMVRAQGRKARVMDSPFTQPLGPRSAAQVWGRHHQNLTNYCVPSEKIIPTAFFWPINLASP
jgi:hypothetical protein